MANRVKVFTDDADEWNTYIYIRIRPLESGMYMFDIWNRGTTLASGGPYKTTSEATEAIDATLRRIVTTPP